MEACHAGPWKSEPAEEIIQLLLDHNAQIDLFQAAAMGRTEPDRGNPRSGRQSD